MMMMMMMAGYVTNNDTNKSLTTATISKNQTKQYSSVIAIHMVCIDKLRVTVGDRKQANVIVFYALFAWVSSAATLSRFFSCLVRRLWAILGTQVYTQFFISPLLSDRLNESSSFLSIFRKNRQWNYHRFYKAYKTISSLIKDFVKPCSQFCVKNS